MKRNSTGNHFINGTGTDQPRGVLADTTAGVTGPVGTTVSLGAQGTGGMGTDILNQLYGSLAEPYVLQPSVGFLLRSATLTAVRNLKGTTADLVGQYIAGSLTTFYIDPQRPGRGRKRQVFVFGDWSRYFVRMVNGIRFE